VRVEYGLTEKGRSLESSLNEIGAWAERWIPLDDDDARSAGGVESNTRRQPA
jgi:DNA-binding HxlR family transcriptional regulator